MRVLSGRLKAVPVATLATVILVGGIVPATTHAATPGLARFMWALGKVESGGDYYARNASTGAYGKYQIMPASWRAWAGRYLGDSDARPTPANQDKVAAGKLRSLHADLGTWRRTAYWWLTGSSRTSGWSSYATKYVERVMDTFRSKTDAEIAAMNQRTRALADGTIRRYSERSSRIAYTGTWRTASRVEYLGDTATYSKEPGATATFTFVGTRVTWYGPVGRSRGMADVSIDGVYVRTVDLYASAFTARKALFSKGFSSAEAHTLTITVLGTDGRPSVGIDGFNVTQ